MKLTTQQFWDACRERVPEPEAADAARLTRSLVAAAGPDWKLGVSLKDAGRRAGLDDDRTNYLRGVLRRCGLLKEAPLALRVTEDWDPEAARFTLDLEREYRYPASVPACAECAAGVRCTDPFCDGFGAR